MSTTSGDQNISKNFTYIKGLNVKRVRNNLVLSTFWWHSGFLLHIAHYYTCNPVHLCQIKFGKERNTTPNDLN